jgi:hypothetical protein
MPLSGGIDFSELNLVGQRIKFDLEFRRGVNNRCRNANTKPNQIRGHLTFQGRSFVSLHAGSGGD